MTATANAEPALEELLPALLDRCERLRSVLGEEQQHIGRRDARGLEALARDKLTLLEEIETLNARRRRLVTEAGWSDDSAGMESLLADRADRDLLSLWRQALALLRQGQAMNEASGTIIRRSLAENQRLLELLHGQDNVTPPAYGPSGTTAARGGRDLGSA